jgi:C-terminal processing protease CtpA/Prc
MKLKNLFLLLPCALGIAVTACHQNGPKALAIPNTTANKLTVKNMQADMDVLWAAIKEMHPAYGIYTSADSLQRAYHQAYSAIDRPLTETEFISSIYPFLCRLKCGHTQLRHSEGYKKTAADKEPHLPFEVLVRDHHAWVTTHQTDKLNTGDEILSMNNIPAAQIIDHGADLYCADGKGQTFKELFLSEYDGFEDACYKYYHWKGPYHINIKTQAGVVKNLVLDTAGNNTSIQPKPVDNFAGWAEAKNTGNLPLLFLKNKSTAYFKATTFQYDDTTLYKEVFKQIHQQGTKKLVLDLRHNTGGDIRIAIRLLSYLADAPFHIVKEMKSRIPDPAANSFEKYFDTSRTASFKMGFEPGNKESSWYHIDVKPIFGKLYGALPLAKANHYNGNLLVLIDGATFSSAALFTAALKAQCKNATFIGRETAGAEEGCNGGTLQHLTLPNTHIVVEFPWMRLDAFAKNPLYARGIIPKYAVLYTPLDVVTKNDPDLKKALSLIGN